MRPPLRLHLPSGRVVTLDGAADAPARRAAKDPLFDELRQLVEAGGLRLRDEGGPVELGTLPLGDFHVLRAAATHLGWIAEESVVVACRNCAGEVRVTPCAALELGPFVHGELDDEELDRPLDLSVPHVIPGVELQDGVVAATVTLAPVTLAGAAPLHRALRRRALVLTAAVVRGLGVVALGDERDPARIAAALARATDEAWTAVSELFLAAHYVPRLCAVAVCGACGARNDVDAPYERELEPGLPADAGTNGETFPSFDAFAARAESAFARAGEDVAAQVRLIVDDGVAACDDGGEPLLGSYVPPAGEPSAPVGTGEIVLYYRTFRAMAVEDGPYDWEAEIDETITHELEHHRGWLVGHDPMDDDERDAIAVEQRRIRGRRAAQAAEVARLGADLRGFIARTWPVWLIVLAATVGLGVCER